MRQARRDIDAVIAQGAEGGGHTGTVPTSLLVPTVTRTVDIPVIAAYLASYEPLNVRASVHALLGGVATADATPSTFLLMYFGVPLLLVLPPTLLMGAAFPVLQHEVQQQLHLVGRRVGMLLVANVVGSLVGTVATGLWLLVRNRRGDGDVIDDLQPQPGEVVVDKTRYSAFFPGACTLPQQLRERGIDTVIIAGTLTNVCCEASARDAMMADFKTFMAADANAARSDAEHLASLATVIQFFGDVRSCDELIAMLHGHTVSR